MKRKAILPLLLCGAIMCGCTAVPDRSSTIQPPQTAESTEAVLPEYNEPPLKEYPVLNAPTSIKLNAEGGVFEGNIRTDGEFDGDGYIVLDEGMQLRHIANIPDPQHYCVALAAHSYDGAVISLQLDNECVGQYYIPAGDEISFQLIGIDCLYLPTGPAVMSFTCESGSAALDYILIENSLSVPQSVYRVGSAPVGKKSSIEVIGVMNFLRDCYGSKVITGQNVSFGTNAEIEAILSETGRSPAIRCGELSPLTDKESAEKLETELALALEWGRNGGLVSYTWHWLSPDHAAAVYTENTAFDLSAALDGLDISAAAASDEEELSLLRKNGMISDAALALIADIDKAAQALEGFSQENIPVIWQPLPEGETSLYWWGGNPESYKKLWQLMFMRLNSFHGLGNLIWVRNGSSEEFSPGRDYYDILGQTIYESSSASFAGRFAALAQSAAQGKAIAVTACDKLPKPEYMVRDNAMWLWFALGSGNVIINADGSLSERKTDWKSLNTAYNSSVCITLDELPDFSEYAVS